MGIVIISTSLNPESKSFVLSKVVEIELSQLNVEADSIDMRKNPLPQCDGKTAYQDANVQALQGRIKKASGIILATPIYNYDINSVAKNLIELTGRSWTEKPVGFLCAAGGKGSYMSVMGIANSLMLDFRCIILPRFIYSTEDDFENGRIKNPDIESRLKEFCLTFRNFVNVIDEVHSKVK